MSDAHDTRWVVVAFDVSQNLQASLEIDDITM
jgi:hypothetical protein